MFGVKQLMLRLWRTGRSFTNTNHSEQLRPVLQGADAQREGVEEARCSRVSS